MRNYENHAGRRTIASKGDSALSYNAERCLGCGICIEACKTAIEFTKDQLKIEINPRRCALCGWCAFNCPFHALEFQTRGEKIVVESGWEDAAMYRGVEVQQANCIFCKKCEKTCPRSAIKVERMLNIVARGCSSCGICEEYCPADAIKVGEGEGIEINAFLCIRCRICEQICPLGVVKVLCVGCPIGPEIAVLAKKATRFKFDGSVSVSKENCVYCGRCEESCPTGAIRVRKPFSGCVAIDGSKCQADCSACIQICPCSAIERKEETILINKDFCNYCGACSKVCPEKAIEFRRDEVYIVDDKDTVLTAV
jgi:4Fe-4S ferredoxin